MKLKSFKALKDVDASFKPVRRQPVGNYVDDSLEPFEPWPVPLDYPMHRLPKLWFIDDCNGVTILNAFSDFDEAINALLQLQDKYNGLVLREYAPTPEEFEHYCEVERKRQRWERGFGA